MLISKTRTLVILTTYLYLCSSICHSMQLGYMISSEHKLSNQADEPQQSSVLKATNAARLTPRSPRPSWPPSSSALSPPVRPHRHRHNHNLMNATNSVNVSLSQTADQTLPLSTTRDFYLYSRCSGHYMQLLRKKIYALAKDDIRFALMSLESVRYGTQTAIKILSKNAGVYLCFNKTGRLVTRYNGDNSLGCLFEEIPHHRYIKFRSVYNPDWLVGFNGHGRPLDGRIVRSAATDNSAESRQHRRREKCYHFVKKAAIRVSAK